MPSLIEFPVPVFKIGKSDAALVRDLIRAFYGDVREGWCDEDDYDVEALEEALDEFLT